MKKKKIWLIVLLSVIAITVLSVATYAYYEFYGQYSSIITVNGTIRLDAFDVLYPELRGDSSYGVTPENPYVIDNVARLQNLIKLNNNGKLLKTKEKNGIDKYYFCFEFDQCELPQVLDLLNEGTFGSIGNNTYPFEDELSGIVYGYEITEGNIVFLSGCLPRFEITVQGTTVYVDGKVDSSLDYSKFTDGTYVKLERNYDSDKFDPTYNENGKTAEDTIVFGTDINEDNPQYIKVDDLVVCHQMVANETIVVEDDQLDVGFISCISKDAYVHDIIIYNTTIICKEETESPLKTIFEALFAASDEGAIANTHKFANADKKDERHIGLFAGHIDGSVANISVAGLSNIEIATKGINYYSDFTTVGYVDEEAYISNVQYKTLLEEGYTTDGSTVSGCLFADNIYKSITESPDSEDVSEDKDGAKHFKLEKITANAKNGWPGLDASHIFEYGSFMFLLSNGNDTVSEIWDNSTQLKLLAKDGYTITGSVLYCIDEYRYSSDASGGLIQTTASVKEVLYSGISSLKATGSVIDAGKYLICARVPTNDGDYKYYAVKLVSVQDAAGNISYKMDDSEAIDVTDFVLDTKGEENLYQSALWNVPTATKTPIFENCRFENNSLTHTSSTLSFGTTGSTFEYSSGSNNLYYNDTETGTQYFVSFDAKTKKFSMSTSDSTDIVLYKISSGYTLKQVTDQSEMELYGDYVIVARSGDNSYLLGIGKDSTSGAINGSIAADQKEITASFPTSIPVEKYDQYKPYIWNFDTKTNSNITIVDKSTGEYYISTVGNTLAFSTVADTFTYTLVGTNDATRVTLKDNGNYYISYSNPVENGSGFISSTTAYNLYLYRLIPQDDTPLYITYQGAHYLDAKASLVDEGDYVIVGVTPDSKTYALGMSDNTNMNAAGTSVDVGLELTLNNRFVWNVDPANNATSTESPNFKNTFTNSKYILKATDTGFANDNDAAFAWSYDAVLHRLFFIQNGTTYYLAIDNTGKFSIRTAADATHSLEICLYAVKKQYNLNGVSVPTATAQTTFTQTGNKVLVITNDDKYYAVAYNRDPIELSNNNGVLSTNQQLTNYLATVSTREQRFSIQAGGRYMSSFTGTNNAPTKNAYPSWNDSNNTTVYYDSNVGFYTGSKPTNPTYRAFLYSLNNGTLTKIEPSFTGNGYYLVSYANLSNANNSQYIIGYKQKGENQIVDSLDLTGKYVFDGSTLTTTMDIAKYLWRFTKDNNNYGYFYNYGYNPNGTGTSNNDLFLCADSNNGSRQLAVTKTKQATRSGQVNSGFNMNFQNGQTYPGMRIAFLGSSYQYYLVDQTVEGQYNLQAITNHVASNITEANGGGNPAPYIYQISNITTSFVLEIVSADGQALDKNIHYTIAAQVGNGDSAKYIAMSLENIEGTNVFTGIEMTSQYNTVMSATNQMFIGNINVPRAADWTQRTDTIELYFYHTLSSTNANQVFMDVDISTHSLTDNVQSSKANFTNLVNAFYYDVVNKLFKTIIGDTTYYLAYNEVKNLFSLTTSSDDASKIHLIRYTPTYKVEMVTDFYDDNENPNLQDGDFIIAGHSVKGYVAIGTNGVQLDFDYDITPYLTQELTEDQYKHILEYVFKQVYYEYNNVNYDNDAENNSVVLQILTEAGTGSFAPPNGSLDVNASARQWKITRQSNGTWKFENNEPIGANTAANSYGIQFSKSGSSELRVKDPNKAIGEYISNYKFGTSFNSDASNIYLCNTDGTKLTGNPVSGSSYYLLAESNGFTVAIGNSSGTPICKVINSISELSSDNNYLWTVNIKGGFSLKNGSHYAVFDNGFKLQTTEPTTAAFVIEDGYLEYKTINRPYSSGDDSIAASNNVQYSTFLYYYTTSGTTITFYKMTDPSTFTSTTGNYANKVIVMSDGTNHYVVAYNRDRIQLTNNNGILSTTTNPSDYNVTVAINNGYTLSTKYTWLGFYTITNYIRYNNSYGWNNTASALLFDPILGFYASGSVTSTSHCQVIANASLTALSAPAGETEGAMTVLYNWNGIEATKHKTSIVNNDQYAVVYLDSNDNNYYLIGYSNGHLSTTVVGNKNDGIDGDLLNSSIKSNNNNLFKAIAATAEQGGYGHKLQLISDNTKYLSSKDGFVVFDSTQTCWEYKYDDVYTNNTRLFTVTKSEANPRLLSIIGNSVIPVDSGSETYLYTVETNNTLGTIANSKYLSNGTNYVIAIFTNGLYYVVEHDNNGNVVPHAFGSGLPTTLTNDMIWTLTYDTDTETNGFKTIIGEKTYYLRIGESGALVLADNTKNCSWSYSGGTDITAQFQETAPRKDNNNNTPLYLFKVSMSNELDEVSDTYTTLTGKLMVESSLSVLDSTNYIITATVDGKTYTLSMKDANTAETLDITATFNEAINGGKIRLFTPSVWNQIGSDYSLVFDNIGFGTSNKVSDDAGTGVRDDEEGGTTNTRDSYLLTPQANRETIDDTTPLLAQVESGEDVSSYIWNFAPYTSTEYLLGNVTDQNTAYLYFDTDDLLFKVTTNKDIAKAAGNKVSIYQLGEPIKGAIEFQTLEITLKDDGITIDSYPLNAVEPKDIKKFDTSAIIGSDETLGAVIPGEYMIASIIDDKYYALILDDEGNISYSDISPLFSGNFLLDSSGYYCISVNTKYLWKQNSSVTYTNGVASGLTFQNYGNTTDNGKLKINGVNSFTFDGEQLYVGSGDSKTYLVFDAKIGFTTSSFPSLTPITIFSVGSNGRVEGGDEPQHNNYPYSLDSGKVDYSFFTFEKTQIPDLTNYILGEDGKYYNEKGWKLSTSKNLSEINSSVYFTNGIAYDADITEFAATFKTINTSYEITDPTNADQKRTEKITYFAPKGSIAFVIPEASETSPVSINVVVSTELDYNYSKDVLRYLAMWKVADISIDENNQTVISTLLDYEDGSKNSMLDYAYTLLEKFYKPNAAIPLPNHYDTEISNLSKCGSYVRVKEQQQKMENDTPVLDKDKNPVYEDVLNDYYLANLDGENYDHLIAHTFTISEPGVYYMGSTYGTLAFCYVSIEDMLAEEGVGLDNRFTIDFVWDTLSDGKLPTVTEGQEKEFFVNDLAVKDINYVGKVSVDDSKTTGVDESISQTWVHSNIFPKFINGTAGIGTKNGITGTINVSNPTDDLSIAVKRYFGDYSETDATEVEYIIITATTTDAIYDKGSGIVYDNLNNAAERRKRYVKFTVNHSSN